MLAHFREHRVKVLFGNRRIVSELKLLFEAAERTFQILLPDVKLKVRSAAFTRKYPSLAIVNLLARFSYVISHSFDFSLMTKMPAELPCGTRNEKWTSRSCYDQLVQFAVGQV
jgi:hypothetical protein